MLEFLGIYYLCGINRKNCLARGRKPTGYIVLTVVLFFVMEIIGGFLGLFISEAAFYIFALLFAALGGLISWLICSNLSFGTYVDPKTAFVQQVVANSDKLNVPASLMIVRDKSMVGCAVSYNVKLNGEPIGQIANGMILNASTNLRSNIISLYDPTTDADTTQMMFMVNDGSNGEIHLKTGQFLPKSCRGVFFDNQMEKPVYNPALATAAQSAQKPVQQNSAAVPASKEAELTCPHCSAKLPAGSLFCTFCGKKI